jgi:hypothetical protein
MKIGSPLSVRGLIRLYDLGEVALPLKDIQPRSGMSYGLSE